jgi:hypothetical protein
MGRRLPPLQDSCLLSPLGERQTIYAVAVNKSMDARLKVESTTQEEEDLAQSA